MSKVKQLKSMYFNNLHDCKIVIVYGNPQLEVEYVFNGDILILKSSDFYEYLTQKSFRLFRTISKLFPTITGCFKCDDDIIPNINSINNFISSNKGDYVGVSANVSDKYLSTHHYNKCSNVKFNIPMTVPAGLYGGGPLYYLSKLAIDSFQNYNPPRIVFEDSAVGLHLNSHNIKLTSYNLYIDTISNINEEFSQ